MKFLYNVGEPSYFPTPLPNSLCHISFSRYSPLSLEVVKKPNKCKSSLAANLLEGRPQLFYGNLLARSTVHRLAKFGWVPFADLPSANSGNEVEHRTYGGWVKTQVEFEAVCGPKFMTFWDDIENLVVVNALDRLSISRFVPKV